MRATLDLEPRFVPALTDLGRALVEAGRAEGGITYFERARALRGITRRASAGLAHALASAGRVDEARTMLADLERELAEGRLTPHAVAVVRLALGDRDEALALLERALREHDRGLVWAKVHPRLDPVRSEPRFQRILEQMGLTS
jgi:tetratricopeptide (TPR) repeat protein